MTNRQKAIIKCVQPWLSEVHAGAVRQMAQLPVGMMSFFFVPRAIATFFSESYSYVHLVPYVIEVIKLSDGFKFRVGDYQRRKGWCAPKFRMLYP